MLYLAELSDQYFNLFYLIVTL